jgi:hypothetical protein
MMHEQTAANKQQDALTRLDNDPKLNALKSALGAKIIPDSINLNDSSNYDQA